MLNYETLISSYDDKLTLMQWLKKVEAALKDASAVSFNVNNRGNATLTFSVVFEDGSEIETGPITLQQGESVQAATIRNGHLILTLTNGDELDAGDLGGVSGFSIDASQHLIVTYQSGRTQDLGAIFTGDVTLTGSLTAAGVYATGTGVKTSVIQQDVSSGIDVFASSVNLNNDLYVEGNVEVEGTITSANDFEQDIKDAINTAFSDYGITCDYGVIRIKDGYLDVVVVMHGTLTQDWTSFVEVQLSNLPQGVMNKIIPTYYSFVDRKYIDISIYAVSGSQGEYELTKTGGRYLNIRLRGSPQCVNGAIIGGFRAQTTLLV